MTAGISSEKKPTNEADTGEFDRRIRERAYLLWEADGRHEGHADLYWHRARELIEDEAQSSMPPPQSRGNRDLT